LFRFVRPVGRRSLRPAERAWGDVAGDRRQVEVDSAPRIARLQPAVHIIMR
jgi:hypothetical protein